MRIQNIKDSIESASNDLYKDLESQYQLEQDDDEYSLQMIRSKISGSQQFIDEAFHIVSDSDGDSLLLNFHALMDLKQAVQKQPSPPNVTAKKRLFSYRNVNKQELKDMIGTIKTAATPRNSLISRTDAAIIAAPRSFLPPIREPRAHSSYRILPPINRRLSPLPGNSESYYHDDFD